MGLSSKQVSSDGLDWNQALLQAQTLELSKAPPPKRQHQQSQQQPEPLKCPRCDSMNTKFCYYNNYNKSQPRHFCKSCKRHWTKGGTLRNVPVGGGRKNKRLKTSNTSTSPKTTTTSTTTTTTNNKVSPHMGIQGQDQRQNAPFSYNISDQRSLPNVLYQRMTHQRPPLLQQNSLSCNNDGGLFLCSSSTSTLPVFPFSSSSPSSFDTNPSSISPSFHSSSVYNFTRGTTTHPTDDPAITSTIMPASTTTTQPWQVLATTTSAMDTANYWNWEDIDTLVSTDLNIPWDDSDIKP